MTAFDDRRRLGDYVQKTTSTLRLIQPPLMSPSPTNSLRNYRPPLTSLLRIPDPRRRRRRPTARHRPRACLAASTLVQHPRYLRRRRTVAGGSRARQESERREGGFDNWLGAGYLRRHGCEVRGVRGVECATIVDCLAHKDRERESETVLKQYMCIAGTGVLRAMQILSQTPFNQPSVKDAPVVNSAVT